MKKIILAFVALAMSLLFTNASSSPLDGMTLTLQSVSVSSNTANGNNGFKGNGGATDPQYSDTGANTSGFGIDVVKVQNDLFYEFSYRKTSSSSGYSSSDIFFGNGHGSVDANSGFVRVGKFFTPIASTFVEVGSIKKSFSNQQDSKDTVNGTCLTGSSCVASNISFSNNYVGVGELVKVPFNKIAVSANAMLGLTVGSTVNASGASYLDAGTYASSFSGSLGNAPIIKLGLGAEYSVTTHVVFSVGADYSAIHSEKSGAAPVGHSWSAANQVTNSGVYGPGTSGSYHLTDHSSSINVGLGYRF
jgi:hypothetical protein